MRISIGAAVAALALLATTGVARADTPPDPLATFQQLCVANQAVSARIDDTTDDAGCEAYG